MRSIKATTLTQESIDKFRNWYLGRGLAENTLKAYTSDLREFLKATGETSIPMEDYEDLAMSWLNMTRRDVAPRTTGRRLTSLRGFARWSGHPDLLEEYIAPIPAKSVPHPIPEGIEGVERMISQASTADQRALVALCGLVGLRVSEALACTSSDFDVHRMELTVRGKGDKTRVVPVSERAWAHLGTAVVNAMQRADRKLVIYQDRSARKCITKLGAKAGLARSVASHDLRATFATAAYDHTKDQRVVQELLGHANGSTTEVYIGVTRDKMSAAVEF